MIIKLEKIISCTSEDPAYPASNLLQQRSNSSWRCAKPGELLASVIFQLVEPSCITGLDIGNYRSCIVIVTASTSTQPDNWVPIVNHQFLSHDEAVNGKFKDQVQLFTKKELNGDTLKIKFDRVKVTCMQSANLREKFGLAFIVLRTEVEVDIGIDVFAKFKLKKKADEDVDDFKNKYLKLFPKKIGTYKEELAEKIKDVGANNFAKRQVESKEPMKRPILEKLEAGKTLNEICGKTPAKDNEREKDATASASTSKTKNLRTPFGDAITTESNKKTNINVKKRSLVYSSSDDENEINGKTPAKDNKRDKNATGSASTSKAKNSRTPFDDVITPDSNKRTNDNVKDENNVKKRSLLYSSSDDENEADKSKCTQCAEVSKDRICTTCGRLPKPETIERVVKKVKVPEKAKKEFTKLFEDVTFSLSGYVNPQRDEIRRKALKMGAKYNADPNTTDRKCTHLICAFQNTPKSQQLKGHTKIVSHKFIEKCFDKKKR